MKALQVEHKGLVAWVWLNRPDRLNAINQIMLDELQDTFASFSDNKSIRAIVLAGRGRAFSSGFDVNWLAERTLEEIRSNRAPIREVFETIERCSQPVIAAVQGHAQGGGLIFVLVADFVLASPTAQFGAPEVRIGIFPSLGLVPRLERTVGIRAAKRIVLTGDSINVQEAQHSGLIDRIITPEDRLLDETQVFAEKLAGLPVTAVQVTKASFHVHHLPEFPEWETDKSAEAWAAPERLPAMQAFLNRKKT